MTKSSHAYVKSSVRLHLSEKNWGHRPKVRELSGRKPNVTSWTRTWRLHDKTCLEHGKSPEQTKPVLASETKTIYRSFTWWKTQGKMRKESNALRNRKPKTKMQREGKLKVRKTYDGNNRRWMKTWTEWWKINTDMWRRMNHNYFMIKIWETPPKELWKLYECPL